ncbi:FAD-dependent oxidoreductase [Marinovum sp. E06]|uniref:FAD-dependent oxidoreductase n=1 Tax=unclassified Marinovum TaxID=2647166 RepID=UPI003EDC2642
MTTPQDIAIVGAGLMGHAIAYALASAGHRVRVFDRSTEALTALPERLAGIADLFGDPPISRNRCKRLPAWPRRRKRPRW